MKLWVTGASGQVGSALVELAGLQGHVVVATTRNDLDITDQKSVMDFIEKAMPDVIINAAAYTAVDNAERDKALAYLINAEVVKNLAKAALTIDVPVLHISTDYVFNGENKEAYSETDLVCPINVYGASKRQGEEYLEKSGVKYINLRTSWVFGLIGANFVKTMIRLSNTRDQLNVVYDQRGGPTFAGDIAEVLLIIAEKTSVPGFKEWGTYHYSGLPQTTWWGLANYSIETAFCAGKLEEKPEILKVKAIDFPTLSVRPINSSLNCTKINTVFNVTQPNWQNGVKTLIASLNGPAEYE